MHPSLEDQSFALATGRKGWPGQPTKENTNGKTFTVPKIPVPAFGLCDLGLGCPELGSVRLSEMQRCAAGSA